MSYIERGPDGKPHFRQDGPNTLHSNWQQDARYAFAPPAIPGTNIRTKPNNISTKPKEFKLDYSKTMSFNDQAKSTANQPMVSPESTKSSKKGQRSGNNRQPPKVTPPVNNFKEKEERRPMTSINQSFGYNIEGSKKATYFKTEKDETLFRDWSVRAPLPTVNSVLGTNIVTNEFSQLDLDIYGNKSPGYITGKHLVYEQMNLSVVRNTNSANGALTRFKEDLVWSYISKVTKAFDLLVQLEIILAWNPDSNHGYDSSLRRLSSRAASVNLLDQRTKLRDVLGTVVLPSNLIYYIKWLREIKLRNTTPESTKLSFRSRHIIELMDNLYKGEAIDSFVTHVDSVVTEISGIDPVLTALFTEKVDCVSFSYVRDHFGSVLNCAVFDETWLDVYNNQNQYSKTGTVLHTYPSNLSDSSSAFFSSHSLTPDSIVVASMGSQFSSYSYGGLPGQVEPTLVTVEGGTDTNQSTRFIVHTNGDEYKITPIDRIEYYASDCTHKLLRTNERTGISRATGTTVAEYYISQANVSMAQRKVFDALFR